MSDSVIFRIPIDPQLTDSSQKHLAETIQRALAEAIQEANSDNASDFDFDVKADEPEVEGAFGGVGEAAILLTLVHLLKAGGIAAAKGGAGAAGAAFVNSYLVPKLRAWNILPGEPQVVPTSQPPAPRTEDSAPAAGAPATNPPADK